MTKILNNKEYYQRLLKLAKDGDTEGCETFQKEYSCLYENPVSNKIPKEIKDIQLPKLFKE